MEIRLERVDFNQNRLGKFDVFTDVAVKVGSGGKEKRGSTCVAYDGKSLYGEVVLKRCHNKYRRKKFADACKLQTELRRDEKTGNGIFPLIGLYADDDDQLWSCVVKEFGDTVSLEETDSIPLHEFLDILCYITEELSQIHDKGFLFLDLSPENIFILRRGSGQRGIKLFDFDNLTGIRDLKEAYESGELVSIPATASWHAPEQTGGLIFSQFRVGVGTDIYLAAMLLFKYLFGTKPKLEDSRPYAEYDFASSRCGFEFTSTIKKKITDFFHVALNLNPEERYKSCTEMLTALEEIMELAAPDRLKLMTNVYLKDLFPPHFAEQPGLFEDIHRYFSTDTGNHVAVITADFSGSGKTVNAAAYADAYSSEYDSVSFIYCADPRGIWEQIKLFDPKADEEDKKRALASKEQKKLLILDNFDESADNLPNAENCDIIVTASTAPDYLPQAKTFYVQDEKNKALSIFEGAYRFPLSDGQLEKVKVILQYYGHYSYFSDLLGRQLCSAKKSGTEDPIGACYLSIFKGNKELLSRDLILDPKDTFVKRTKASFNEIRKEFLRNFLSVEDPVKELVLFLLSESCNPAYRDIFFLRHISVSDMETLIGDNVAKCQFRAHSILTELRDAGYLTIDSSSGTIVLHNVIKDALIEKYAGGDPGAVRRIHFFKNFLSEANHDYDTGSFPYGWLKMYAEAIWESDRIINAEKGEDAFVCRLFSLVLKLREAPYTERGLISYEQSKERCFAHRGFGNNVFFKLFVENVVNKTETYCGKPFTPDEFSDVPFVLMRSDNKGDKSYYLYFPDIEMYAVKVDFSSSYTYDSVVDKAVEETFKQFIAGDDSEIDDLISSVEEYQLDRYSQTKGEVEILYASGTDELTLEKNTAIGTVTKIGPWAFSGSGFNAVYLPSSVSLISHNAFYCCEELEWVTFDSINEPSKLKKIGESAFAYCKKLKNANLPGSLEEIEVYAFLKSGIIRADIPNNVKRLKHGTFCGCERLSILHLNEGIEEIVGAFSGCTALRYVVFEKLEKLKEIGANTFRNCEELKVAILPDSLEAIGPYAFSGCEKLDALAFSPTPGKVVRVGYNAFFGSGLSIKSTDAFGWLVDAIAEAFAGVDNDTALNAVKMLPAYVAEVLLENIDRTLETLQKISEWIQNYRDNLKNKYKFYKWHTKLDLYPNFRDPAILVSFISLAVLPDDWQSAAEYQFVTGFGRRWLLDEGISAISIKRKLTDGSIGALSVSMKSLQTEDKEEWIRAFLDYLS